MDTVTVSDAALGISSTGSFANTHNDHATNPAVKTANRTGRRKAQLGAASGG
jgi:hypothetical protein